VVFELIEVRNSSGGLRRLSRQQRSWSGDKWDVRGVTASNHINQSINLLSVCQSRDFESYALVFIIITHFICKVTFIEILSMKIQVSLLMTPYRLVCSYRSLSGNLLPPPKRIQEAQVFVRRLGF